MTTTRNLLAEQSARFARLDPAIPAQRVAPVGEPVVAALPDGRVVGGVVVFHHHPAGTASSLWSARYCRELTPLLGSVGAEGLPGLLAAARPVLVDGLAAEPDSAVEVIWPSRDAEVARVLLDHGFVPLSVLAIRTSPMPSRPAPADDRIRVRRAGPGDLAEVLDLAMAELGYSALVGGTVVRPDARHLKEEALRTRLAGDHPVWLAEVDGLAVGLAECAWSPVAEGSPGATRLPTGLLGYVNCVSVAPGARGLGVGQLLMARAHEEFDRAGTRATYLYYNPPNPLSSVFWPRQGYRPLWTIWETRPATGLRHGQ
ncbi:GNAT family N-acetyltransferase [Actinoalloteichus spitiensis]|uniref:GNAT family N-acetyltransferase n=1 Tax=Actinoalloteichus spitiensis TaxID=252394 RepID=UPI000474EB21|nr:GNAT family N-acetyltransferase [Actinoalloteichus spitiensis]